ncbi:hypothetical protein JK628_21315 [Shewanella sp. KX20019]|uniref:hypothetical protein n=1 Tax=Shewanella sp. KX20019 TaxID=2803864 RepID=UPI001926C4CA|nr:hypothetical protein [Shewanella sp. KX20019]QQX79995.1 hypothetical protein JK628_21315 [Shewanella sp. KX20019]
MTKYPSVSQAKAHAKYISRTLNIKLSHAKESVAYMYSCFDFRELCDKSGLEITEELGKYISTPSVSDLQKLVPLLEPHIQAIREHINPIIHLESSVLSKIAKGKLYRLSRDVVSGMLCKDTEADWSDSASVIKLIEFLDDSVSTVLLQRSNKPDSRNYANPWIKPTALGLKVYGTYHFNNKFVDIVIREFDFQFDHPLKGNSIARRQWFGDYVVGYLRHIAEQLISLGYQGNLKLCRVNNLRGCELLEDTSGVYATKDDGQSSAFYNLLIIGGKWSCYKNENEKPSSFGVEIPLSTLSVKNRAK